MGTSDSAATDRYWWVRMLVFFAVIGLIVGLGTSHVL